MATQDYSVCWNCHGTTLPVIETHDYASELRFDCPSCGESRTPFYDGWHLNLRHDDIDAVLALLSPEQCEQMHAVLSYRVNYRAAS